MRKVLLLMFSSCSYVNRSTGQCTTNHTNTPFCVLENHLQHLFRGMYSVDCFIATRHFPISVSFFPSSSSPSLRQISVCCKLQSLFFASFLFHHIVVYHSYPFRVFDSFKFVEKCLFASKKCAVELIQYDCFDYTQTHFNICLDTVVVSGIHTIYRNQWSAHTPAR